MDDILAMMSEETWMGADECLEQRFCTSISGAAPDPEEEEELVAIARASRSLGLYRNLPEKFREQRPADKKTKRADGEDLTADCFLFAADDADTSGWKLPWKFSTREQTRTHLTNSLMRFNEVTWDRGARKPSKEDEKRAWNQLVMASKEHGIDPTEGKISQRLTPQQRFDFMREDVAAQAQAKIRAIQASL